MVHKQVDDNIPGRCTAVIYVDGQHKAHGALNFPIIYPGCILSKAQAEKLKLPHAPPKVLQSTQKQREMKDASFTKPCEGTLNAFSWSHGSSFCLA